MEQPGLKDKARCAIYGAQKSGHIPDGYKTELPRMFILLKVSGNSHGRMAQLTKPSGLGILVADAVLVPCPDECSRDYAVSLRGWEWAGQLPCFLAD